MCEGRTTPCAAARPLYFIILYCKVAPSVAKLELTKFEQLLSGKAPISYEQAEHSAIILPDHFQWIKTILECGFENIANHGKGLGQRD